MGGRRKAAKSTNRAEGTDTKHTKGTEYRQGSCVHSRKGIELIEDVGNLVVRRQEGEIVKDMIASSQFVSMLPPPK